MSGAKGHRQLLKERIVKTGEDERCGRTSKRNGNQISLAKQSTPYSQAPWRSLNPGSGVGGVDEGSQGRSPLTDDHKPGTAESPFQ